MKKRVTVSNSGIESSGLPKDYMSSIAEYIWNGFDATASNIDILFDVNNLDYIQKLQIRDNGKGIDFSMLDKTFGNFNDSIKKHTFQKSSSTVKGNKGRGRFSFTTFSGQAIWHTTYLDKTSDKYLAYDITVRKNSKDFYEPKNNTISPVRQTGTTVVFDELFNVTGYSFSSPEFINFLAQEFGWFLLLNKDKGFSISINGTPLDYEHLIVESDIYGLPIKDAEGTAYNFKITFIRWSVKIGDKFYFYFLNALQDEVFKELTSFNNNAINFNHSIYIESTFFDSFKPNDSEKTQNFFEENKNSPVYKVLVSYLHNLVRKKEKEFIQGEAAEKFIDNFEKTGVIPRFKNNKYDQAKRKDLIDVVKGLYCIEPTIFQGSKDQQKVSVGLINLLLDSEERECIIDIIGQVVELSSEERKDLAALLRKTTVSKISKTINIIEIRFRIIEYLKALVFDLTKFTNERDHIQKVIEDNYWLFGEQYHIVSKNEGFELLLSRYLELIASLDRSDEKNKKRKTKIDSNESNRRPDVFVCRKHSIPDVQDNQYLMEENLIVELKRPTVDIGKDQIRQIEDYLDIIKNEPSFNSRKRFWKFIIVGNKIDQFVEDSYEAEKAKGKKFLVKALNNFEIFAYTWDDIFMMFDLRHKFLIDNLDFDKNVLKAELAEKGIDLYKEIDQPNMIVEKVIELSNQLGNIKTGS